MYLCLIRHQLLSRGLAQTHLEVSGQVSARA